MVSHNVPAGDGIRAIAIHTSKSGSKAIRNEVVHNGQVAFNFDAVEVAAGDKLDFVVNFHANLNNDQFLWSPELKLQEKTWHAERDFAGKQLSYLTPWEQLAQVLLLSNELVFID
jgi:plastocyanin